MTSFTNTQIDYLQELISAGNIGGFYDSLTSYADPYGLLGIGVTNDPSLLTKQMQSCFGTAEAVGCPLIFDLDGDGVEAVSLSSSAAVYWDIDNDGFREASARVGKDDGLLVRDLNNNGGCRYSGGRAVATGVIG